MLIEFSKESNMAIKKPDYKTQREAEDSIGFDLPPPARSNDVEILKNSWKMKKPEIESVLIHKVRMNPVSIHPVKMEQPKMLSVRI
jgi:hypothetical protein